MSDDVSSGASQALLAAALGGLLCAATACGGTSSSSGGTGATGTDSTDTTGSATASAASDAGTVVVNPDPNGDTPKPDLGCAAGVYPQPSVTTRTVAMMTADEMTAQCASKNGIFEVQPNCGGSNACRGMSYDADTQTLTEHTCRATNSCAGFSCVVCN